MASQYFGFNRNADYSPDQVTTGTSSGSTDVEVRVDLTKVLSTEDITLILKAIIRVILDGRLNSAVVAGTETSSAV